MADDVNVTEIDLMKAYSGKLADLKDYSLPIAVLIFRQVKKIREDLEHQLREVKRLQMLSKDSSRHLTQDYKSVIDDVGDEAREVIGSSDLEAARIQGEMDIRIEQLEHKIRSLQTLLKDVFQHTKNYELQITDMVDSCRDTLDKQIQALIDYKNQHN